MLVDNLRWLLGMHLTRKVLQRIEYVGVRLRTDTVARVHFSPPWDRHLSVMTPTQSSCQDKSDESACFCLSASYRGLFLFDSWPLSTLERLASLARAPNGRRYPVCQHGLRKLFQHVC